MRVSAGIILLNGVRLEVSKAGVWMCDFRDGGCVGFDCVSGCLLYFCMVDGCCSLVYWGMCIPTGLSVSLVFL